MILQENFMYSFYVFYAILIIMEFLAANITSESLLRSTFILQMTVEIVFPGITLGANWALINLGIILKFFLILIIRVITKFDLIHLQNVGIFFGRVSI